jgi:hydrogenase maturation protease
MRMAVYGCGNPWNREHSLGLEVLRRLSPRGAETYAVLPLPQPRSGLFSALHDWDTMVFVDGISSDAPAGTIHLFELPFHDIVSRRVRLVSGHAYRLHQILELALALGRRLPRMVVLGIEGENLASKAPRSPEVERAIVTAVKGFPRLISMLMNATDGGELVSRRFLPNDATFPDGWADWEEYIAQSPSKSRPFQ